MTIFRLPLLRRAQVEIATSIVYAGRDYVALKALLFLEFRTQALLIQKKAVPS